MQFYIHLIASNFKYFALYCITRLCENKGKFSTVANNNSVDVYLVSVLCSNFQLILFII